MKTIWNYLNKRNLSTRKKTRIFLLCTTLFFSLTGLLVWFFLHFFVLATLSWAVCFMGYPGLFLGLWGGILFLYRQEL